MAIITGGNTGIGLEKTKMLSAAGATVIIPARDIQKAGQNPDRIARVEIKAMDIMEARPIDAFSDKFLLSNRLSEPLLDTL